MSDSPSIKPLASDYQGRETENDLVIMVVNHAKARQKRRKEFFRQTGKPVDSMPGQPRLVGHSLRQIIPRNSAWTLRIGKGESRSLRAGTSHHGREVPSCHG